MGNSISNFIDLLVRGDFFLIFLIIMMVIIIGVIVYLVKLQINDTSYYDKDDEEDDEYEEDFVDNKLFEEKIEPIKEEAFEERPTTIESPLMNVEAIKSNSLDLEETVDEFTNDIEDELENEFLDDIVEEEKEETIIDDHTYDNLERPVPIMEKKEQPVRHIEQSRFDFENEDVVNSIKSFEEEQEATAIISASELESRINELKESGEYAAHERKMQEYEEEQETKAIISYDELLNRANSSIISYESEENLDGIHVGKVDTSNIETFTETNDKPYYREEAFLEAMKEFRRAL